MGAEPTDEGRRVYGCALPADLRRPGGGESDVSSDVSFNVSLM